MHTTVDNGTRDRVDHLALNEALERTGAEHRVQATLGEQLLGAWLDRKRHALLGQTATHVGKLDVDDLLDLTHTERVEHHDVVDAVQELGPERMAHGLVHQTAHLGLVTTRVLGDRIRTNVARHDDDRVLEAHLAALAVGEATIIEHLQQHVEHVRVRLLHLIQQDDGVGPAANRLGELTALVVPHVSGRRADEALDAELLHVLGHVDAHERALIVEQALGKRLGELGLAHTGGAEEEEAADGAIGIGEAGAAATHGCGDGTHGLVLADDAAMQLVLETLQLLELALHHLRHGHAGPRAHDLGDLV